MRFPTSAWIGAALLSLLTLTGCDGLSEVRGTVTLDDRPLESGAIMFTPVDGNTQVTGGKIRDGRYSVRVPQGVMKVSISAPKVVGKKKIYPTADSPEMPVTREALPARYNEQTELTLDVTAGTISKDWELTSE